MCDSCARTSAYDVKLNFLKHDGFLGLARVTEKISLPNEALFDCIYDCSCGHKRLSSVSNLPDDESEGDEDGMPR